MKTNVNTIIDDWGHLPLEDREYVVDILNKQIVEARREKIAKRSTKALSNLKKGKVSKGSAKDLYKELEND